MGRRHCAQCIRINHSPNGAAWWTHTEGQTGLQTAALKRVQAWSCMCKWTLTFCQCFYLTPDRSFVLALLPEHAGRFQKAEISTGAWSRASRAGELKSEYTVFWGRLPAYQALQRVPSWFSSVLSVITVAGWLHYSVCISHHSQCFSCVVSFLLYSDSV